MLEGDNAGRHTSVGVEPTEECVGERGRYIYERLSMSEPRALCRVETRNVTVEQSLPGGSEHRYQARVHP